ncbi:MAG: hypothetical protein GKS00_28880 [Alphaproteobacteria bacterium]|nr:hypothetical protein [Alphaproteobacteria bacterium]
MAKGITKIEAGTITFTVRQEQWDANIHNHADQGVIIDVEGQIDGTETALLRFTCFDIERSYTYAPEGRNKICRMDPIVDGNPIGWTVKQLRNHLPEMLTAAGYEAIAEAVDTQLVSQKLDEVDIIAREKFINGRRLVKHNRGTDMFEAGIIRFGLEMRTLGADGGLAIHVLTDLAGTPTASYAEETEVLAFDCFRKAPHYHYGPRNKNHRVYFDKTIVKDPLEWTLGVFKARKLSQMIAAAGYPGVAADVDEDLIASLIPSIEAKAREMQPKTAG